MPSQSKTMTHPLNFSSLSVYKSNGYASRAAYLEDLADQAGYDSDLVYTLADLLGPEEDFDGLITALQDAGIEVETY